jgi:hypothetical protein
LPYRAVDFPPIGGGLRGSASPHQDGAAPPSERGANSSVWPEMKSRRLMQLIKVAATRSGHPNVVFAAISLVVSALTILTLRSLIELWGAL